MSLEEFRKIPAAERVRLIDDHHFIKQIDKVSKESAEAVARYLEEKKDQITRVVKHNDVPKHEYAVYGIPKEAYRSCE